LKEPDVWEREIGVFLGSTENDEKRASHKAGHLFNLAEIYIAALEGSR
jgi:hypothetical protein